MKEEKGIMMHQRATIAIPKTELGWAELDWETDLLDFIASKYLPGVEPARIKITGTDWDLTNTYYLVTVRLEEEEK